MRTARVLLVVLLVNSSLAAGADSRRDRATKREQAVVDHLAKQLDLPDATRRDLLELSELMPHAGARILHGKLEHTASGALVVEPDSAAVHQELSKFDLDEKATQLFATVVASQGNILQAEHDSDNIPTTLRPDGELVPPTADMLRTWNAACKSRIEMEAAAGASAYREFKRLVGRDVYAEIRDYVFAEQERRWDERSKRVEESNQKARADCLEGLKTCSFPEGVVSNCAGYLKMTVKELQKKCPATNNLNEK